MSTRDAIGGKIDTDDALKGDMRKEAQTRGLLVAYFKDVIKATFSVSTLILNTCEEVREDLSSHGIELCIFVKADQNKVLRLT